MGKISYIYCYLKYIWTRRSEDKKFKKWLTCTLSSLWGSTSLLHWQLFYPCNASSAAVVGSGVSNSSSLLLLPSHPFPLLQNGFFCWDAILQDKSTPARAHRGMKHRYLLHHGPLHRLQDNVWSGTWRTASPSFFSHLSVCTVESHLIVGFGFVFFFFSLTPLYSLGIFALS